MKNAQERSTGTFEKLSGEYFMHAMINSLDAIISGDFVILK